MLDLIGDGAPDPATRLLRARGERNLGEIRLKLGHTAEAVALMESARQGILAVQASGHHDPDLVSDTATRSSALAVRVSLREIWTER